MDKKRIAREWLYFAALVLGGVFIIVPLIALAIHEGDVSVLTLVFRSFTDRHDPDYLTVWTIALSPYILTQLIRSIIWAVRALRENKFSLYSSLKLYQCP